ncbi:hypothetical protein HB935_14600, partial [Listeria welshimeri]|nr:hypothetical protein [Listeria welshimeri]
QLSFAPFLPHGWENYRFKINFRDRLIEVKVEENSVEITLLTGKTFEINVYGELHELKSTLKITK